MFDGTDIIEHLKDLLPGNAIVADSVIKEYKPKNQKWWITVNGETKEIKPGKQLARVLLLRHYLPDNRVPLTEAIKRTKGVTQISTDNVLIIVRKILDDDTLSFTDAIEKLMAEEGLVEQILTSDPSILHKPFTDACKIVDARSAISDTLLLDILTNTDLPTSGFSENRQKTLNELRGCVDRKMKEIESQHNSVYQHFESGENGHSFEQLRRAVVRLALFEFDRDIKQLSELVGEVYLDRIRSNLTEQGRRLDHTINSGTNGQRLTDLIVEVSDGRVDTEQRTSA
jgi:hypothetical protein